MKKPIFDSEQEAREFLKDVLHLRIEINTCNTTEYPNCDADYDMSYEKTIREMHEKGYIKKSAVEEAERMFDAWINDVPAYTDDIIIQALYEAIKELKARLKDE